MALITQGLGELDKQVKKSKLEFKINDLQEKVYVRADGKFEISIDGDLFKVKITLNKF